MQAILQLLIHTNPVPHCGRTARKYIDLSRSKHLVISISKKRGILFTFLLSFSIKRSLMKTEFFRLELKFSPLINSSIVIYKYQLNGTFL